MLKRGVLFGHKTIKNRIIAIKVQTRSLIAVIVLAV